LARGNKHIARDQSLPYHPVFFSAAVPLIQATIIMTRREKDKKRERRPAVHDPMIHLLMRLLLFDYERHELNEYVHET